MIRNQLKKVVDEAIKERNLPKTEIEISETPAESFGDYSTNVALRLSSLVDEQLPSDIAKKLIPTIANKLHLSKVTYAEPGFINFSLEPKLIQNNIQKLANIFGYIIRIFKGQLMSVRFSGAVRFS